jgi:hypothetical protein
MNSLDAKTDPEMLQDKPGEKGSPSEAATKKASEANCKAQNEYNRAKTMLESIALGTRNNPEDFAKTKLFRTDAYSEALIIFLAHHLGIPKNKVVSLCLAFTARQLTNRTVTSQNDLAVLLHGLQFAVHDLAIEAREFRELALNVADQESYIMDPPKT